MNESPSELVAEWLRLEKECVKLDYQAQRILASGGIEDPDAVNAGDFCGCQASRESYFMYDSGSDPTEEVRGGQRAASPTIEVRVIQEYRDVRETQSQVESQIGHIVITARRQGVWLPEFTIACSPFNDLTISMRIINDLMHHSKNSQGCASPSELAYGDPVSIGPITDKRAAANEVDGQAGDQGQDVDKEAPDIHTKEFRRDGDHWIFAFNSKRVVFTRSYLGFRYIQELLRHPGEEFALEVLESLVEKPKCLPGKPNMSEAQRKDLIQLLAGGDNKKASLLSPSLTDALLDGTYLRQVKARIEALEEEKETTTDPHRACEVGQELDRLRDIVRKATFKGKSRRLDTESDGRRSRITDAIRKSTDKIRREHSTLADHFDARIKTGFRCKYEPDPNDSSPWSF